MYVTFYGAVREVTGSMHLLTTDEDRVILDAGLFQGRRKETNEKNRVIPFDPNMLTNIVLSHAHIDHSGRIPLLTKHNFTGRIICTRATAAASEYLLRDSAHIQESDANYLNYKTVRNALSKQSSKGDKKISNRKAREIKKILKKNRHDLNTDKINELIETHRLEKVEPLYRIVDADEALELFDGYPYRHPIAVGKDLTCTFYDAGHILGSAFALIRARQNGRDLRVCYTGDIGRFDKPIIKDPTMNFSEEDRQIDLLIMESTYGDRLHEPVQDLKPQLKKILVETHGRGGSIIIPSFAFGRTQELLYTLHELYDETDVPRMPIYVDSPLATKITRVFGEHPEVYDEETHDTFLEKGKNPFSMDKIHFVGSVEESIALNHETKPHIVLSASGMCEAGRILHHLRYKIHNEKNTVLMVGYQAQNTLGRRILDMGLKYAKSGRKGKPPVVRFYNKEYPLKAHVVKLGGFSAHADKKEMLRFLKESNLKIKKIALVHGEEDQILSFADFLKKEGFSVVVPRYGESIEIK
ncbi:MAG: MBL fold metallo-hydrolase [Desulfobacterales bacterium]|jgi:metallo-beta-lactamase family protein